MGMNLIEREFEKSLRNASDSQVRIIWGFAWVSLQGTLAPTHQPRFHGKQHIDADRAYTTPYGILL